MKIVVTKKCNLKRRVLNNRYNKHQSFNLMTPFECTNFTGIGSISQKLPDSRKFPVLKEGMDQKIATTKKAKI